MELLVGVLLGFAAMAYASREAYFAGHRKGFWNGWAVRDIEGRGGCRR